ncbi:MAG: PilZ domain-containing protein [Myxococcota bacterium]
MTQRRAHERFELEIPITLLLEGEAIPASTRNIGLGGVNIVTEHILPYGTELKIRLRLPALKDPAEIEVVVRWAHEDGIGVQFGSLRAREVWALNQLCARETKKIERKQSELEGGSLEERAGAQGHERGSKATSKAQEERVGEEHPN